MVKLDGTGFDGYLSIYEGHQKANCDQSRIQRTNKNLWNPEAHPNRGLDSGLSVLAGLAALSEARRDPSSQDGMHPPQMVIFGREMV